MKIYGYVRVSSTEQNEDRQLLAMQKLEIPSKNLFVDKQSGKDFNRPNYRKLINRLQAGDLLYITSIDRLSRNKADIKKELEYYRANQIRLKVLDLPTTMIDLPKGQEWVFEMVNNILIEVLGTIAEQERETIRKRQSEGIAAAKLRGVRFGRPDKNLPENFGDLVRQWERQQIKTADIVRLCGLSRSTFYAKLKEYRLLRRKQGKM